jgi:hypothetical protein
MVRRFVLVRGNVATQMEDLEDQGRPMLSLEVASRGVTRLKEEVASTEAGEEADGKRTVIEAMVAITDINRASMGTGHSTRHQGKTPLHQVMDRRS